MRWPKEPGEINTQDFSFVPNFTSSQMSTSSSFVNFFSFVPNITSFHSFPSQWWRFPCKRVQSSVQLQTQNINAKKEPAMTREAKFVAKKFSVPQLVWE